MCQEWITNLVSANGKLISNRTKKLTIDNLKFIEEETSFLPIDSKLNSRIWTIISGIKGAKFCECGEKLKFDPYKKAFRNTCSFKCACKSDDRQQKTEATKLSKYGNKMGDLEKRKRTNIERYGVENYTESEEFKIKNLKTITEKYGVTNVSQIQEVKDKKVGKCDSGHKTKEIFKNKRPSVLNDKTALEKLYKGKTIVQIGEELGVAFSTVYCSLVRLGIDSDEWRYKSGKEQEVADYITSLGFTVIRNTRNIIAPKEIDIFVPEKNLAIEFNGVYWHSITKLEDNTKKNIEYHKEKTDKCNALGIELLSILDIEWKNRRTIWESMISQKLGISKRIYARKCDVVEINSDVGDEFIDSNHMQGKVSGGKYFALLFDGEPVSVLQAGKSRFSKKYDFEILRFCSKAGVTVVGGFSKLLKRSNISGTIVSYANRRWSSGKMYEKNGFELIDSTSPNYWYWNKNTDIVLESRMKYQKHKLSSLLSLFDSSLTEFENMLNNEYNKICDSGNLVYQTIINKE